MLAIEDVSAWSEDIFGQCSLGDKRLTKRLVQIGKQLASFTGCSLSQSCEGNEALIEGSYRLVRNERFKASQIGDGGYDATAKMAQTVPLLLAIEDSTMLSYTHEVSKELGHTCGKKEAKTRGYIVHSTLLMDADKEKTIGLIAQERWCRDKRSYGKKHKRKTTVYEQKESYKWEKNTYQLEKRLVDKMKDTISVCDREADIYEYIQYKLERGQRFIVRAEHNRKLIDSQERLFVELMDASQLGTYEIEIGQKGGRKKRKVKLSLKAKQFTFMPPKREVKGGKELKSITLNVVMVREENPETEEILEWILLTTESIASFEDARRVSRYYELRWRIEDFHKAWKSGTGAERQRMQSADNLEKMIVILSFIAVRLLQLKEYFEADTLLLESEKVSVSCEDLLTEIEWKVLWKSLEKKDIPSKPPSASWAYQAIAKLGGWCNSKRTGKAAWSTVWTGWFRLTERVEGFMFARAHMVEI